MSNCYEEKYFMIFEMIENKYLKIALHDWQLANNLALPCTYLLFSF